MAQQTINTGSSAESGDGDNFRAAWTKAVNNFTDLDTRLTALAAYVGSLGNAASRNMGTTPGTVADGGNLTNEINRAQAAEALLAPIASPTFTGTPAAPTAAPGTNTTQLATTAFVTAGLTAAGAATNAVLYVTQSLTSAQQLQTRQNISAVASGDTIILGNGSTATTPSAGDSTNKVATTAFATGALNSYASTVSTTYAPLASPALTGTPTAPTPAAGDNSTAIATTAFVDALALPAMQGHSLIINGFQNVSQQFGTTTVSGSGVGYTTDQWIGVPPSGGVASFQQVQAPFPSQPDIPNGIKLSITTAEATLAAGDSVQLVQPLEGTNLARLAYGATNAKTVTLAFMIRPSITLTGYVSLATQNSTPATIRSYAARFAAAANADTFVYLTIPGDTAQTLLTGNVRSLDVRWCFGSGTTGQGTAGAWSGSNILAASDVTNLAATVGNTVILSGAVMLPGVVPITQSMLPLLARRYDDELKLCQRYYTAGYSRWDGYVNTGIAYTAYTRFPVTMRATPTLTYSSPGAVGFNVANPTTYTNSADAFWAGMTSTGTGGGNFSFNFAASARM